MTSRGMRPDDRSGWRRRARFAAVALACVLGALAFGAASAPALIVRLGHKKLSYQPAPAPRGLASPFHEPKRSSGMPLEYHGGPVMTANTNYPLYWDPAGASEYPAGYRAGINTWFEDLAHDSGGLQNTDSVLTQYTAGGETRQLRLALRRRVDATRTLSRQRLLGRRRSASPTHSCRRRS